MNSNIFNIRILVVGAGGIGCELLKNLVLTGFKNLEVIDLDTIELSNLNRQFLFQKIHVGHSKAEVASKNVLRLNPEASIIAHHDSVMNPKYSVDYFKSFDIVLNALDNKAARSHVNRLCLAADVPLIESGSAGYLGQVTVIKKGKTECYDCLPKPPVKTFPGCTIRNTPSEPVHCIVWAKHLFNQLFGKEDPDEAVSPDTEDPENGGEEKENIEQRISTRKWASETNYDAGKIFNKLYNEDIKYLLSMEKLWETRKPPVPLEFEQTKNNSSENGDCNGGGGSGDKLKSQNIWSVQECLDKFCTSLDALKKRLEEVEGSETEYLIWDKDDEVALTFVTAAANLRSIVFSIQVKSKFDVKSIAGNIIPAIATTNAVIAGFIVLQAMKAVTVGVDKCKTVFLRDRPALGKLIVDSTLVKPNEKCYVCASKPELIVRLDVEKFTIKQLEAQVLKTELNMIQPDVEIDDGSGRIILSSEEGETDENHHRTLYYFGLRHGSRLKCDDFLQNYEITITLFQDSTLSDEFKIDNSSIIKQPEPIVDQVPIAKPAKKRSWSGDFDEATKKRKISDDNDDEIIADEEVTHTVNGNNNNNNHKASNDEVTVE